ncbi:MAG: porin [Zoogloeaceae bacterium]|jgi:predicted porin|nr:porin [Zoogloeaceae bacterium]
MQKKLIALAVATLASGAVLAQSNVTVYGAIDVGYTNRGDAKIAPGHAKPGSTNQINSGQSDTSKIGFTGVEDLGNGVKALFVLEAGFYADDGKINDQLFSEQAFLGLTGGFGTAIAGRLVAPRHGFLASIDPFGAGTVGQYRNVYSDSPVLGYAAWDPDRVDNAVAYVSPSFGGFNVTAAYATNAISQETAGNDGDFKTIAILPRYTNGPLDVGVSYQRIKNDAAIPLTPLADVKLTSLSVGASYDFKVVKVGAFYDQTKLDAGAPATADGVKHKVWLVGVTVPFGKNAIQASYTQSKYDGWYDDDKARQWAIGYTYALSKRTNFYAAYSDIKNDGVRNVGVDDASNNIGGIHDANDTRIGAYERGIQLGLKHTF